MLNTSVLSAAKSRYGTKVGCFSGIVSVNLYLYIVYIYYTMVKCHDCGKDYEALGNHWSLGSCNYPELNDRQVEILKGMMMGDGGVYTQHEGNPWFATDMVKREFLEWLSDELGSNIPLGITNVSDDNESHKDIWRLRTRNLPCLEPLHVWYNSGKKRFPDDMSLTPLIAKMWYVCDGTLKENRLIRIGCSNELDRPQYLTRLFSDIGIDVAFEQTAVRLNKEHSMSFLEYIGDPVPGFSYKWV